MNLGLITSLGEKGCQNLLGHGDKNCKIKVIDLSIEKYILAKAYTKGCPSSF